MHGTGLKKILNGLTMCALNSQRVMVWVGIWGTMICGFNRMGLCHNFRLMSAVCYEEIFGRNGLDLEDRLNGYQDSRI